MDRQAGFLLALLFLANFLTIEADTLADPVIYFGHTHPIEGKPWFITCDGLAQTDKVEWTRNGVPIQQEIDSKELTMNSNSTTSSTLSAAAAKPSHQGEYKCTSASSFSHYLQVHSASPPTEQSIPAPTATANVGQVFHVLSDKNNLTLGCNTTSIAPVFWQIGKNNVTNKKDHYELQENGKLLVLGNPTESLFGNYTCRHNNSATDFLSFYQVIGAPLVRLPGNSSVVEGEKLHLTCLAPAYLDPQITWYIGNDTYSVSKDRVNVTRDVEQGIDNAILTVENVSMADNGFIYCRAKFNKVYGNLEFEGFTQLTVKDKLAALWPFLGICAEVVILCAIILVYEKKRNKTELDESDTDQSPDTKPTSNKDSEVRQRK